MIPVITIISVHWFVIVMVCLIVKSRTLYKIMYIWNPMLFFSKFIWEYIKNRKIYSTVIWLLPMEETLHTCICMTNVENIAYLIASFYYFTNINYNFHIQEEKFNSFLSIFKTQTQMRPFCNLLVSWK